MRLDRKTVKICTRALSISDFLNDRISIKHNLFEYGVNATRCAAAIHDNLSKSKYNISVEDEDSMRNTKALARTDGIIANNECFSLDTLAISGNDLISLGYPQGHELGKTLISLLSHVIKRPEDNTREILFRIAGSNNSQ
jgi:tRNA nucleotidyltransferase (CCA-adding enzyme)